MLNIGRPVRLNRHNVSDACLNIYWKQGINNISYNDVIKKSKLSKGTFYKLFANEDDLQAETLINYDNDNINLLFDKLSNAEDLFELLNLLNNWKFKNDIKYCYFFIVYMDKYRVGIKTRKIINKIATKYKSFLISITKKHIGKHDIKASNVNINQVVNFIFNGMILMNLLYRNKSSQANINLYKKSLYQFVSNVGINKNYKII